MSDNEKKDLTRIEDLGEYLHELNQEEDVSSFEPPSDLPDVPSEETDFSESAFGEESSPFETSEDSSFTSEEPAFGSSEEDSSFTTDESPFGTTEESSFTSEGPAFGAEETSFSSEESTTFGSDDNLFNSEEPAFGDSETTSEEEDLFATSSFEESQAEPETAFEPEPVPEPEPEPEPEPIIEEPIFETKAPEPSYKAPENFEDLKKFAESTSITGMGAEGNPSFSVLLKNVRYIEDVNDIMSMLKELSLLSDGEEQIRARLMRGHLLVPRISEYAAIFLAHKLRRFDIDIQVGLSDEIHPPKHQEAPETGLVSRHNLYQNQTHHFHFDDPKLDIAHIIVAASPNLEGHQVIRYLGVASEHKMLDSHVVEDEGSEDIPRHYTELAQKLKAHALKAHANAVIGLNYQLTPLPSEYGLSSSKYRLSCTGNLVWVNKL